MRFVLILIALAGMFATAWHAVQRGTQHERLLGAPQIQAIVDQGVRDGVEPLASHPIAIETDGRNVNLSGVVDSEAQRQAMLAAARQARLLVRLTDDLVVLPRAAPFRFSATKNLDGAIVLSGNVPNAAAHEALVSQARSLSDGTPVADRLVMAAGAPEGDWQGMAATGLGALAELRDGAVTIEDTDGLITGAVTGVEAGQRLMTAINTAPMGQWQVQIAGALPVARIYAFSAMKTPDGSLILDGNAPDDPTRDDLLASAQAISIQPLSGDLTLADGMPSGDWPAQIKAGLTALGNVANGLFKAEGDTLSFLAEVETDDDLALLLPLVGDGWQTDITVRNPTPLGRVEIALAEDGALSASGLLPEGVTPGDLDTVLPGVDLTGIDADTRGRPADWTGALQGLEIILPRFQTAAALIEDQTITVTGRLKRGFSADGASAAMKSALASGWSLAMDLQETAPLAEVMLSKQDGALSLTGLLPTGLTPDDALKQLGETASGEGLSGGGDGDAPAWYAALGATGEALDRFRDAAGRMSDGQIELNGNLLPGYPATDMQAFVADLLPGGWTIGISADEIPPGEGDQRVNLTTGEGENFRRGFWLPDVDFEVSVDQCRVEIERALAREDILFVTGSARIDGKGRALLNRLAAVSVRCLNSSVITLEIAGHTDSVGNDDNNMALSQQRAEAVQEALLARGVRAEAVTAKGYGETQPVATNDTPEGRAQNRRISFDWSDGGN